MIFSGLIFVDEGAHRTDAYQNCRNLFMSDDPEAKSMPGLEINADDVKCSRDSTSARISDDGITAMVLRLLDDKSPTSAAADPDIWPPGAQCLSRWLSSRRASHHRSAGSTKLATSAVKGAS